MTDLLKGSTQNVFAQRSFLAQRERVKLLSHPKKCYFHSPLVIVWLTMTSPIESTRLTQYTPLYKNEQIESKKSQWRQLKSHHNRGGEGINYGSNLRDVNYECKNFCPKIWKNFKKKKCLDAKRKKVVNFLGYVSCTFVHRFRMVHIFQSDEPKEKVTFSVHLT